MTEKKPPTEVTPILHNLEQTARRLNVSRTTVYSEINRGELEVLRIGDRPFTTDEMLRDYVARKRRKNRT